MSDCPNCGATLDAATCVTSDTVQPSPGDLTLCIYCGHLMAFGDDLSFRKLTDSEAAGIDPRTLAVQRFIRARMQ
jgi:hypothetical protein